MNSMDIKGGTKTKGPLTNIEPFEPFTAFTIFTISQYLILTTQNYSIISSQERVKVE